MFCQNFVSYSSDIYRKCTETTIFLYFFIISRAHVFVLFNRVIWRKWLRWSSACHFIYFI